MTWERPERREWRAGEQLVTAFAGDEEVSTWKSCRLLRRLFKEQCEVVEANDASSSNNAVGVEAPERSVSESGRQGDADTAARSPPQPAQDDEEPDSREQDAQTAPPPTHVDVTEQAESAEKATTAVRRQASQAVRAAVALAAQPRPPDDLCGGQQLLDGLSHGVGAQEPGLKLAPRVQQAVREDVAAGGVATDFTAHPPRSRAATSRDPAQPS